MVVTRKRKTSEVEDETEIQRQKKALEAEKKIVEESKNALAEERTRLEKMRKTLAEDKQAMLQHFNDLLVCSICQGKMKNPIRICENDHYFCAECVSEMFRSHLLLYDFDDNYVPTVNVNPDPEIKCPLCRITVSLCSIKKMRNDTFYKMFTLEKKACQDCGIMFEDEAKAKHILECPNKVVI